MELYKVSNISTRGESGGRSCTYDFNLAAELSFCDLGSALLVEVGGLDLVLEVAELGALGANLLDLPRLLLLVHLHARHLPRQVLLH
jgi:hypothetical protein